MGSEEAARAGVVPVVAAGSEAAGSEAAGSAAVDWAGSEAAGSAAVDWVATAVAGQPQAAPSPFRCSPRCSEGVSPVPACRRISFDWWIRSARHAARPQCLKLLDER